MDGVLGAADDGVYTPEQRWAYYISSYTSFDPTEGVPYSALSAPFLKRSVRALEQQVQHQSGLPPSRNGLPLDDASLGGGLDILRSNPAAHLDLSRLDHMHSKENLGLRISPDSYRIHWSVAESTEWWIAAPAPSSGNVVKSPPPADTKATDTMESVAPTTADIASTTELYVASTEAVLGAEAQPPSAALAQDVTAADSSSSPKDEEKPATDDKHTQEAQAHEHDRTSQFEEKFVMNNSWMAGLTRDEVEERKGSFRKWTGVGVVPGSAVDNETGAKDKEDVVMAD